ncbi:hypothetical protein BJ165DRAFT_1527325 [Panaeolus papilionaceus]|nr:hypothetical protein BJ165DRAFT_1527325 [Panaeolus papilionaceus]
MPPRTRSNRAAITEIESLIAAGKLVNSTGFESLPNELYGEIVSHIPKVPVTCHTVKEIKEFQRSKVPSEEFDRHSTLHSLSRTCGALCQVFLRYLWETLEVYDGFKLIDGRRLPLWSQRILLGPRNVKLRLYAEELLLVLSSLSTLGSRPRHATFSGIFNDQYHLGKVGTTLRKAHRDLTCQFPQVRHLYIDSGSSLFPSMCPNLVSLSSTSDMKKWDYRPYTSCPWDKIGDKQVLVSKSLGPFVFTEKAAPVLKSQGHNFGSQTGQDTRDTLDLSDHFKRLQIIRIRADQLNPGPAYVDLGVPEAADVENWVKWAEGVLRRIQRCDKQVKRVYLTVHGGEQTLYLLEPGQPTKSLPLPPL